MAKKSAKAFILDENGNRREVGGDYILEGGAVETNIDPTVNDDSSQGYSISNRWVNTSTGKEFVLVDSSVGVAVWKQTTGGGGNDDIFEDTKEPTGFVDSTDLDYSFVDVTRTFTIQPDSTSYSYYIKGTKYTKNSSDSIVIPDVEGMVFIYFDGTTITSRTNFNVDLLQDFCFIVAIYWDATNSKQIYFGHEWHEAAMDWATHIHLHQTVGLRLQKVGGGGGLTDILVNENGNLDSHAQFGNEATVCFDEDIKFTYTARTSTSNISVYYRDGLDSSNIWRVDESASFPVLTAGTGRAAWNQLNAGTWSQTELVNGRFVLAHIFVYNDPNRKYAVIQGQNEYTNVGNARDGAEVELSTIQINGLPSQEFKFLGTIILQSQNGYSNTVKSRIRSTDDGLDYVDWRDFIIGGGSQSVTTGKSISKLFEGIFTQAAETVKVTNVKYPIPLDFVVIKDDYFSHTAGTAEANATIEVLVAGWYEVFAMLSVKSDSASGGTRGNPELIFDIDKGSGWEEQPDRSGGYIRENSAEDLSTNIAGSGFFFFEAGWKFRIATLDTVATEPDESIRPYATRITAKYIDRTAALGAVIENLKDIGDINANAPNNGDILQFDSATSKWISAAFSGGGSSLDIQSVNNTSNWSRTASTFADVTGMTLTTPNDGKTRDYVIIFCSDTNADTNNVEAELVFNINGADVVASEHWMWLHTERGSHTWVWQQAVGANQVIKMRARMSSENEMILGRKQLIIIGQEQ